MTLGALNPLVSTRFCCELRQSILVFFSHFCCATGGGSRGGSVKIIRGFVQAVKGTTQRGTLFLNACLSAIFGNYFRTLLAFNLNTRFFLLTKNASPVRL
jgi:hypothetical protein